MNDRSIIHSLINYVIFHLCLLYFRNGADTFRDVKSKHDKLREQAEKYDGCYCELHTLAMIIVIVFFFEGLETKNMRKGFTRK